MASGCSPFGPSPTPVLIPPHIATARQPLCVEKGAVVSTIGGPHQPEQCRRKDSHPPMTSYSADGGLRPADPQARLRLAALIAVIAGVILLAAAAFVLSYEGIHHLALRAGVSSQLARLYPVIFDAMMVIAAAAALALRGAGWWAKGYAWFSLLLMLAAVAVGNAVYATNVTLPAQPTRAVVAVTPWVLLLLAFGLLLEMLRYFRRPRPVSGQRREPGQAAAADAGATASPGTNGTGGSGAGQRAAVTWAAAAGGTAEGRALPQPRTGLDTLLGPREGEPPAMPASTHDGAATAEYAGQAARHGAGHYPDPVAYGEETGYVHPDSYRDHGDYPGADGPAAHEGYAGPGEQDRPEHTDAPGQPRAEDSAPSPAEAPPAPPPPPASPAEPTSGPQPATENAAETTENPAQTTGNPAESAGNSAETAGQTAPAKTQDPPPPIGDARRPARSVMPLLERLRSTPAPPQE